MTEGARRIHTRGQTPVSASDMADPEVKGFLALLAARRAARTVDAYRRDLADLTAFLGRSPAHATTDDLQAWLADLLAVFGELGWGYALWEFEGPFGIVGHTRPGAVFENLDGFRVDRRLLDLMQANRGVS